MKLAVPEHNQSGQTMGSKGLRTRTRLIDTTVALLERTPLRDLKVVDIAVAAQTSAATFYVYFDGVIDVVLAATAELSQSTPEILAVATGPWDAPTSHDRALDLVTRYVDFWDAHRALLRTRNLTAEEGDERFTRTREASIMPLLLVLVDRIGEAQRDGRISARIFPYASGGTLLMMLERLGALAHQYDGRGVVSFDQMKEAAAHTVSATLGWPIGGEAAPVR